MTEEVGARYLYHFTSAWSFQGILAVGEILPSDPALTQARWGPSGFYRYHTNAPDVVYLSSSREPNGNGLGELDADKSVLDKVEVRITLTWSNDSQAFEEWCQDKTKDQDWLDELAKDNHPEHWYVLERPVPWRDWLLAEDLKELRVIWSLADGCSPYLNVGQIAIVKDAMWRDLGLGKPVRSVADVAAALGFVDRAN